MPASRLIVCETSGQWASGLRCALSPDTAEADRDVIQVDSLEDCRARLVEGSSYLVALETTADNFEAVVAGLRLLRSQPGVVAVIILAERDLLLSLWPVEALLLEAGATWVAARHQLAAAARLISRCFAITANASGDIRADISQRVPWPPAVSHETT